MKDKNLPAGITQEMVDAAKEKYGAGAVKLAELPKDDDLTDSLAVLIRRPDRVVLNEYAKWMDKNPGKADEIMVNSCLLSHKDIVKADDGLFLGAVNAISQLIPVRKATVKNI